MNNLRKGIMKIQEIYGRLAKSQNVLRVSVFKRDFPADIADSSRCYSQKRCNILKVDLLYDLRTSMKQIDILLSNGHSIRIKVLGIDLVKQMLVYMCKGVIVNNILQFYSVYDIHIGIFKGNNRNNGRLLVYAIREVAYKLFLE